MSDNLSQIHVTYCSKYITVSAPDEEQDLEATTIVCVFWFFFTKKGTR